MKEKKNKTSLRYEQAIEEQKSIREAHNKIKENSIFVDKIESKLTIFNDNLKKRIESSNLSSKEKELMWGVYERSNYINYIKVEYESYEFFILRKNAGLDIAKLPTALARDFLK